MTSFFTRLVRFIPNLLSLLNAFLGCVAVYLLFTFEKGAIYGSYTILFGCMVCDVLDGWAARKLQSFSPLGVDLDSLADAISFGVAPALILATTLVHVEFFFPPLALLLVPFSVYRLAKFNHDTRQKSSFLGLPTPSSAAFVLGLSALLREGGVSSDLWVTVFLLTICYLVVSEVPMFGLKEFSKWSLCNKILFCVCCFTGVGLFILYGLAVLSYLFGAYILFNLIRKYSKHLRKRGL